MLQEPAARASRVVARTRLDELNESRQRLLVGDAQALHDFRVALRRMRTWMNAFRPYLDDTVRRKSRRSLSKLARLTNAARDAEIGLASLNSFDDLPAGARRARGHLRALLKSERDAAMRDVQDYGRKFDALVESLQQQLSYYRARVPIDGVLEPEPMRAAMSIVLRQNIDKLARALKRVRSAHDVEDAHRARIAAKRLRYLLDALDASAPRDEVIARLTAVQDALGEFHDAHVIVSRILDQIVATTAAAERRRARVALGHRRPARRPADQPRPTGLLDLAKRIEARGTEAFARFVDSRDDDGLVAAATAIADEIGA